MINKITSDIEPILKAIPDGATIMTSGFGVTGQPAELIEALIDLGKKELTIVNNNAASGDRGLTKLIIAGCVRKMISSFPIADRCVQIHGGAGYISEYAIERFYRDVRLFRLYEGTTQVQQLIIAKNMIRDATA